eukprot:11199560-Lingulodinium_polyedra.AAC.1
MFAAAALLAWPDLQNLCRIVATLCEPLHLSHGLNQIKGPAQVLGQTCGLLVDPAKLSYMGFEASYAQVPKGLQASDPLVLQQDGLAEQAFRLVLELLRH